MDEELMFHEIKDLCIRCGLAIDKIAKDCNINQNLVAKMFMKTMQNILDKTFERTES